MTTITASSTIGIRLSDPPYYSPIYIEQGVTITTTGVGITRRGWGHWNDYGFDGPKRGRDRQLWTRYYPQIQRDRHK